MRGEWRPFRVDHDHVARPASRHHLPWIAGACRRPRRRNADVVSTSSRSTTCRVTPTRSPAGPSPSPGSTAVPVHLRLTLGSPTSRPTKTSGRHRPRGVLPIGGDDPRTARPRLVGRPSSGPAEQCNSL